MRVLVENEEKICGCGEELETVKITFTNVDVHVVNMGHNCALNTAIAILDVVHPDAASLLKREQR